MRSDGLDPVTVLSTLAGLLSAARPAVLAAHDYAADTYHAGMVDPSVDTAVLSPCYRIMEASQRLLDEINVLLIAIGEGGPGL